MPNEHKTSKIIERHIAHMNDYALSDMTLFKVNRILTSSSSSSSTITKKNLRIQLKNEPQLKSIGVKRRKKERKKDRKRARERESKQLAVFVYVHFLITLLWSLLSTPSFVSYTHSFPVSLVFVIDEMTA